MTHSCTGLYYGRLHSHHVVLIKWNYNVERHVDIKCLAYSYYYIYILAYKKGKRGGT